MSRLDAAAYLEHIRQDSRRFRDVLAVADPVARVPSCPEWTAADLVWHLAIVQRFWATIVAHRPAGIDTVTQPQRPDSYGDLLRAFDAAHGALVDALGDVDPADHVWSWAADQTAGFTFRRQAHEALIHRLDAELTAATVTPLDRLLAADGVDEVLGVMFGCPESRPFDHSDGTVRIRATDTGDEWFVALGRVAGTGEGRAMRVVADPGDDPAAVVSGPASALDAWLWNRRDRTGLEVVGRSDALDHIRKCVSRPLD